MRECIKMPNVYENVLCVQIHEVYVYYQILPMQTKYLYV